MKTMQLLSVALFVLFNASASADEREDLKKYLDYYVGEWEVTQEVSDQKGSLVVTNTETGNAHISVYKFGEMTTVGIWGYDPATKKWVGTGFSNNGGHFKSTIESRAAHAAVQPGDVIRYSDVAVTDEGNEVTRWSDHIKSMDHFVMKVETPADGFSGEYSVTRKK